MRKPLETIVDFTKLRSWRPIAVFDVGEKCTRDHIGAIVIEQKVEDIRTTYRVFINGGHMPNKFEHWNIKDDEYTTPDFREAFELATELVKAEAPNIV